MFIYFNIYSMNIEIMKNRFIEKSIKKHGDLYLYDKVEYKNPYDKIKIYCKKCNKYFLQSPHNHLQGCGCQECKGVRRYTTEEFIEKSKEIHGNLYDYSLVEYINWMKKIKIICKVHGIFEQTPSNHLSGSKCSKCQFDKKRSNKEEFIEKSKKIHGEK